VPLAKFPPKKRPDGLTTIVATLGLILYAVLSPFSSAPVAPPVHLSPVPSPGSTVYGNDISWPQCAKSDGGNGLPGPMDSATFAVLGLTDGGSFRANPCLASQVASVRSRHLWAGAYAISTYPTDAELARYGGTGTLTQQLRRVGAAQAAFNLGSMARVGLQSPMIWVDVEPSTRTPWSAEADQNNAVIDGVIAGYKAAGIHAGIYSYDKAWKAITGARRMPGVPTWVPVGLASKSKAASRCAAASYAGSKPWLTQWTDDVYDYNLTCPGVTGRAARGNLLTPYLNVRLASGSRGSAVVMLQRHLGAPAVDGVFGATTHARVIAFQRAHHLPANGLVGSPEWRALGAGSGTHTPPVPGFMGTLFAST
jgi:peptidoglycan hydrolase-like protein with peptidoglycan-binding domain